MVKKFLLGYFFLNFVCFAFGEVGPRQYETAAGYSICPPRSWEDPQFPGQPGKMLVEPNYDGYPAMMTFVTSYKPGTTLEGKWQEGLSRIRQAIPGYKGISTTDFITSKGLKGKKHIYSFQAQIYNMRGVLYAFVSPHGTSVNITCGVLAEYGDIYDGIFDESVASLEITK
jgi:hypothetical protein